MLSLKEDELPDVEGDLWHVADEEEGDDEEEHHGLPRLLRVRVGVGVASHRVAPPLLDATEMMLNINALCNPPHTQKLV